MLWQCSYQGYMHAGWWDMKVVMFERGRIACLTQELAERIAAVSDPVAAAAGETPAVGVDGAAAAAAAVESEKTATGGAQKSKASYSAFRKVSSWRDVQRELIFAAIIVSRSAQSIPKYHGVTPCHL